MDKEVLHTLQVLDSTKKALKDEDSLKLRDLSDQTIHSACGIQDGASVTLVVLIYSLSKIIERKDNLKIKDWDGFIKKFISILDLATKALKEGKTDKYENYLLMARKSINSTSISVRGYIEEILRKASINKASKIYEHGISLGQTAQLLGVTQWELAEYTGQTKVSEAKNNITLDVKTRAKMAMEFFS